MLANRPVPLGRAGNLSRAVMQCAPDILALRWRVTVMRDASLDDEEQSSQPCYRGRTLAAVHEESCTPAESGSDRPQETVRSREAEDRLARRFGSSGFSVALTGPGPAESLKTASIDPHRHVVPPQVCRTSSPRANTRVVYDNCFC
jgi:hypothetical protein